MISPNGLYGHVPLPHATEFEFVSGFDLVYLVLLIHWSHFADIDHHWQPGGVRQTLLRFIINLS